MYPGTHAAVAPGRPAVIMAGSGEVLTYGELDERSMLLAQLLAARRLGEGDRISILAENHLRYLEAFWAALRSGLYVTGVNSHPTAAEAGYVVASSGAKALLTTPMMAAVARQALSGVPGCRVRLIAGGTADGFEPYGDAIAGYPARDVAGRRRGEVLLYSSGTTGRPKGVFHPLPDKTVEMGGRVSQIARAFMRIDERSVYLSPAPLYHAAPLIWSGSVHELGGTVVVMERFSPESFLESVERYQVTHSQLVPTMFVRMLKLPGPVRARYDRSSLRQVIHAAAPCPVEVKRAMIDWWGPIISEYYASTEGNCFIIINTREWLAHPGSVGKPIVGTPHVCDPSGVELPAVGSPVPRQSGTRPQSNRLGGSRTDFDLLTEERAGPL